ncbi:MAG: hypothetical protein LBJ41_11480 [Treponema sp.]|jgi:hypothetical protein|nr:hypothetical protein [Treponema sp.]
MSGGQISGNIALLQQQCVCGERSGGTIYGSNVGNTLKTTAHGNSYRHAVYVYSESKKHNSTAGMGVTLDSSKAGLSGGWGENDRALKVL